MSKRIHLLALPPELRIAIYDAVLHAATDIDQRLYAKGDALLMSSNDRSSRYLAPWCSLMLTCSQIATELRDYMAKQISQKRCSFMSWVVEFKNFREIAAKQTYRRRSPCSPSQLRVLRLEIPLNGLENPWDVARVLHQTVSLVLRRGLGFDAGSWLPPAQRKRLHIREIHLAFYWQCSKSQRRYGLGERITHRFRSYREGLEADGAGKIETIKLIDEYYEQAWPAVKKCDTTSTLAPHRV